MRTPNTLQTRGARRFGALTTLTLALVCIALTAVSCGSGSHAPTPQPLPDAQQILRAPLFTSYTNHAGAPDVASYDPALATDATSATIDTLIYPALVTLDSHLAAHLWAAQSMNISADGLTITFSLRSGMRFSDGEPIDAKAFAYALNRTLDPCTRSPNAAYLYPIANAYAFNHERCAAPREDVVAGPIATLIGSGQPINPVDPLTLKLTLSQPSMRLLTVLTMPFAFAVPQAQIAEYGPLWTEHLTDHGGFGGGLFKLTQTVAGGGLRLTRNTAFWGASPRLREIDYSLYTNNAPAWSAFQAGKLDIGFPSDPQVAAAPKSAATPSTPLLNLTYLGLNWRVAPFSDQRLRQALALAINKQAIATQRFNGLVIPTNHIVPQGMTAYNPALVGPDSSQSLTGNVPEAVNLARSFASTACKGKFALCPAITLEVSAADTTADVVGAEVARMWQAVAPGYPLTVKVEPAATYQQRVAQGAAQLYLGVWTSNNPDAHDALGRFTPSLSGVSGSVNLLDATALVMTGEAEQDPTQRVKDEQAAEQLFVSAVAIAPLYQAQLFWQASARVQNVTFDPLGQMSVYDTWPTIIIMGEG